eukprot:3385743-Pleurochrysis_carterae.AAC.1
MAAATAQPPPSTAADAARPATAAQQPRTLRDLPAGAVARMTALKAESGAPARRAAGAAVLRPLTTMAALLEEAEAQPAQDVVAEARRLVTHADFGSAAWAAIFSSG